MAEQQTNGEVILEKIGQLRNDVTELKGMIQTTTNALVELRQTYTVEHIKIVSRTELAHERINKLEVKVEEFAKMFPLLKVEAYIISALSVPTILWLLALLWQLITNQISITTSFALP